MSNHEIAPGDNPNAGGSNPGNPWNNFTAPEFAGDAKQGIDLQEIDRSTKVGWLIGSTLDVYDAVAKAATDNGLSSPIVLGSGAMYMHAANSGRYSMSELNEGYDERRSFTTTSHGVDIDLGFTSEDEVNRFVAISGSNSRQIEVATKDGQMGMADIMARPPRSGFDPIPVKVGEKEVMLRNPEAMLFGKIDLLNETAVDKIKQKWGYDVPMYLNIAKSYHQNDDDFDEYLSGRYLEYQSAGVKNKLQQLPAEAYLGDILSAKDAHRVLPGADDEMIQRLLDSRVGEINADNLPPACFAQWDDAYASAMDKYRQANLLAAQRAAGDAL